MRTRVKICGITNAADLQTAVAAGVDAIGLNMVEASPRYVTPETAAALAAAPPLVTIVGLFANHSHDAVMTILSKMHLDLLQFHGDESDEFCKSFGRPYIKALRVSPQTDVAGAVANYPGSSGILLDACVKGIYGGTGVQLDWHKLPRLATSVVLAGGLTPDNVGDAIRLIRPWGVDVSSGVEASPGKKDADKIQAFMAAVRAADEVER